jgi:hypothetical protein
MASQRLSLKLANLILGHLNCLILKFSVFGQDFSFNLRTSFLNKIFNRNIIELFFFSFRINNCSLWNLVVFLSKLFKTVIFVNISSC